jgi:hypothetical protein
VPAWPAALIVLCLSPGTGPAADPAPKEAQVLFESDVAPILKAHCWKCHAGAEPANGLRLTTRTELLRGGESGPAIRIKAAESSLLWEKIASDEMPAEGPPLTAEQKGILRTWINAGAAGDGTDGDVAVGEAFDSLEGPQDFWSFRPPVRPAAPAVRDATRIRNPIDRFIVARLESRGLGLSPEADRPVLLRRATYDLLGLPPTPEDVREFLADPDERAYERLIDRLLASPHYGERWGRHWLDLAGYADSAGILAEDRPLPTAFRYRDYVVRAFNDDKPYDRFLQEQIAGDELSDYWTAYATLDRLPEDVVEAVVATGYLRCAADASRPDFSTIKNADAQYFYPTLNDTLQIIASSTLGLTLQCARCHSHKYDPIPQADYYRLQAIFMPALRPSEWIPQMDRQIAVATASQQQAAEAHNAKLDTEIARITQELTDLRNRHKQRLFDERLATLPDAIRNDVQAAVGKPAEERTAVDAYLVERFGAFLQPDDAALDTVLAELYAEYRQGRDERNAGIAAQERQRIQWDYIRALYDLPGPVTTPLLRRGDPLTPGPPVEPGVLTALNTPEPFDWSAPAAADARTSGRRLAFARWLTQRQHPLTARVLVNRLWLLHFGEGIVSTPADFGTIGAAPSHPELLDWLACELVDSGWSIKHIHRLILTSEAYRQQSRIDPDAAGPAIDPDNRLLWRGRLRRLEAEAVRDAVLQAADLLDDRQFGPPVPLARRPDGEVNIADGQNGRRRSIYLQILRANPLTMLEIFDQPVMETNCTRRSQSTVATQALTLLNSEFMRSAADGMADRLRRTVPDAPISEAVLIAFARTATPGELQALTEFVAMQQANYRDAGNADEAAHQQALADMCHILLSSNEFLYID